MLLKSKGSLFIISSPSGVGKTTVAKRIASTDDRVKLSISATTRDPRDGEVHGVDYDFMEESKFLSLCKENNMLEYAKVFDHYYGTPSIPIKEQLSKGIDVICCIDWQGADQVRKLLSCITIFLLPPSLKILKERLSFREHNNSEVVDYRLSQAKSDSTHYHKYDYVVVNSEINETVKHVMAIIAGERYKTKHQDRAKIFVDGLLSEKL